MDNQVVKAGHEKTRQTERKVIPAISRVKMIEVDRIMVQEFGIGLIQMMENAGSRLAGLAGSRFLGGDVLNKKVLVLAGSGANGGGVLAAARHLFNRGADVGVYITKPESMLRGVTAAQLRILRHMGVCIFTESQPPPDKGRDLILDGIIGYNLRGAPTGLAAKLIGLANADTAPVLSMDVPSGLDADRGRLYEPVVNATATMTLGLPKKGFYTTAAEGVFGELYLADIGVPPSLYNRGEIGLEVGHVFSKKSVIRLR